MVDDLSAQNSGVPSLCSKTDEKKRMPGEVRLRALSRLIPSDVHAHSASSIQQCINAAIFASQEYVEQIIQGLALLRPAIKRKYVVKTTGLNAIAFIDQGGNNWVPTYPVITTITQGILNNDDRFGFAPIEPAIKLDVNRNDEKSPTFCLSFSVSLPEDMRALLKMLSEQGSDWLYFESLLEIMPFSDIPLPSEGNGKLTLNCLEYVKAFIQEVVDNADNDDCIESLELQFTLDDRKPLHEYIVAAIAVFNAFEIYANASKKGLTENCREAARLELEEGAKIWVQNNFWQRKK